MKAVSVALLLTIAACASDPGGSARDGAVDLGAGDQNATDLVIASTGGDGGSVDGAPADLLEGDRPASDLGLTDLASAEVAVVGDVALDAAPGPDAAVDPLDGPAPDGPSAAAPDASRDLSADISIDLAAPEVALDLAGPDAPAGLEILALDRDSVDLHCPEPIEVKVRNNASRPSGALSISLADPTGPSFAVSRDDCSGKALAPQETCSLSLSVAQNVYSPGDAALTVRVAENAGLGTQARLSLRVWSPESPAALFPAAGSSADFPRAPVGTSSAANTFVLMNGFGFRPLMASISLTGDSQDFVIDVDECTGRPLAFEDSCRILVHFHPTVSGQRAAILRVEIADRCPWIEGLYLQGNGI
jgi:hypothetical protein